MLLLVLLSQAAAEWVQISQQHYEKPVRATPNYPPITTAPEVEITTKTNRIYINHSLPEYWNKGTVYKVPNVGNVKRVQLDSSTVRNDKEDTTRKHERNNGYNIVPRNKLFINSDKRIHSEPEHRFPNVGNVQRVQLSSTEKPRRHIEVLNMSDLEYVTEEDVFSTIEIGDDSSNIELFTQKKHLTAKLPAIKDKPERGESYPFKKESFKTEDDSKNYGIKTDTVSKDKRVKEVSTIIKSPTRDYDNKFVKTSNQNPNLTNKGEIFAKDEQLDQIIHRNPNIIKEKRVKLVNNTAKATSEGRHVKRVNTNGNKIIPNTSNSIPVTEKVDFESNINRHSTKPMNENTRETHTTVKTKYPTNAYKNYEPIKRPKVPNPEDAMIEEILKEETKLVNNAHRTGSKAGILKHASNIESSTSLLKNKEDQPNNGLTQFTNSKMRNLNRVQFIEETSTKPADKRKLTKYEASTPNESNIDVLKTVQSNSNTKNTKVELNNRNNLTNLGSVQHRNVPRREFITSDEDTDDVDNFEIVQQVQVTSTEEIPIRTTVKVKPTKKIVIEEESTVSSEPGSYEHNTYQPMQDLLEPKPEFVTKDEAIVDSSNIGKDYFVPMIYSDTKSDEESSHTDSTEGPTNTYNDVVNNVKSTPQSTRNNEPPQSPEDKPAVNVENNTKTNSLENLVTFIKVVTETISKNTRKSFKSKLQYLEDLRDTIAANIEERIKAVFPNDPDPKRPRTSRAARAHAAGRGHHVEFPSSEGALMTISFLTFAVFLIKLVLQVIHTYKNKAMMVPAVVATVGRAVGDL